ncbi:MAG: GTPase HflX [Thermomicrobiales bacterium]|nr:GTPase HflX [Thermomicrobiales bacterium]
MLVTNQPKERALLMGVETRNADWRITDALEELARLTETVDVEVVGAVSQKLDHPIAATYVGKGKVEEIKDLRESLGYELVIANDELTPSQQRNLEKVLDCKVLDRTGLILDVFARRARTHEGRLQVELAQLEYRMPRLTRMWTHLSRQAVGGVGLRGPGETQLESDRREIGKRIAFIKDQLSHVHTHRQLYRDRRKQTRTPVAALVGYTNAGKSTLLNTLTGAGVLAEDQLFATLDPTTRKITLPGGRDVLLTDTVGFINNLPTMLIAAFRATLEEINEASVLIHVLDVTHPNAPEQAQTVLTVLEELGADDKPMVWALNKVDQIDPEVHGSLDELVARLPIESGALTAPISGATGYNVPQLLAAVSAELESLDRFVPVTAVIPYADSALVDQFHKVGRVDTIDYVERGTVIHGQLPEAELTRFGAHVAVESEGITA